MNLNKILLLIPLVALLLAGCSTVPVTGRKQLMLVPPAQIAQQSATAYRQVIKKGPLSQDREKVAQIKRVGNDVSVAVEKYLRQNGHGSLVSQFKWEFNLIENKTPNAWCMPGGKVVFYTGILPYTKDDAGVAVIMGHEIAHAVAGHGAERISQQLLMAGGAIAISEVAEDSDYRDIYLIAYGLGGELGAILPYSRIHESEADKMGLIFMAMAGYNPNVAIDFWQRMASTKNGSVPEFMSTHPSDATRINQLRNFMPEAMKYYKPIIGD